MKCAILLAEQSNPYLVGGVILAILVVMGFFSTIILLKSNYKRCSSNQVLVIFGKTRQGQAAKTIHGGAAFVFPLFQDYRYLVPVLK